MISEAEQQQDEKFDRQILQIVQHLSQGYFINHQNDDITWLALRCILQLLIVSYSGENGFEYEEEV